ncbi:hypothetical protein HDF11_000816 [Tunturiibacter psychrotolerans]
MLKDNETVSSSRVDCRSFDCASRDETARRSAQDDNFYIHQLLTFYINQLIAPGLLHRLLTHGLYPSTTHALPILINYLCPAYIDQLLRPGVTVDMG